VEKRLQKARESESGSRELAAREHLSTVHVCGGQIDLGFIAANGGRTLHGWTANLKRTINVG
jgi:hypothetical protein